MTTQERNILDKKVHDLYWANEQRLYIASIEVMGYEGKCENGPISIYALDKNKEFDTYLFDVRNYNSFYEQVPTIRKSILYPRKFEYKEKFDVDAASSSVFYQARERVYTIPKFTTISSDDVMRCFEHFRSEVLEAYCLFNIKWHEFEEQKG